ncbi:MBL fold metallo-hydrolase [Metabacillus bambusae]|uniref:MBL fold metallo-hydrolase n=1 Tax=Metabacillus bambusae TaxID=2795218 RepID=A0ABS3N951_9BACI|nr:MBL fold metallo-hydrolase [Metabacillus bambusae]MBO1514670.1 MBL fold metallo-hydrolase [Metabacillus bambusae]
MKQITQGNQVFKLEIPTPFPVGDVNVYVIKGDCLTLVDAGPKTEEAWLAFQHQLKEIGYTPQDIEQIVVTHHHPDHVGMLDYFSDEVPVIGHFFNTPWLKKDQQFIVRHATFFEKLFIEFGVDKKFIPYINQLKNTLDFSCERDLKYFIREGEEINGLFGWRILETPGHAQSHIALYEESTGILIGGDLLLKHISPNPLLEPPMTKDVCERPRPQLQLNQSISRLLDLPISLVYAGHGENIDEVHKLIAYRLKQQSERAELVRSFLAVKPLTAFQACQTLFPTIYHKQLILTISETVGQLDYLVEMEQIIVDTSLDTHRYIANEC